MENNIETMIKKWEDRLEDSAEQYNWDKKYENAHRYDRGHRPKNYTHFFYERMSSFFHIYRDDISQELKDNPQFRQAIMQKLLDKIQEFDIPISDNRMLRMIEFYPKSIEYIDCLESRYGLDERYEILLEAVKKNPEIIDILPKEKLVEIAEAYERHSKGNSDMIMQLISNNSEIIKTATVQELIKDNPELGKQVKIFELQKKKEEKSKELDEIELELAELQGEKGDTTHEKE